MSFPECSIFEPHSRRWQICRGESNLPEEKVNRYRKKWGMEPLYEEQEKQSIEYKVPELTFHGISVDKEPSKKLYGPGTELLKIYEEYGAPHCDACSELAQQMNNWGVKECRNQLDFIADDMLPRAKRWIDEKHPWVMKLVPNSVEIPIIKEQIKGDINAAITAAENTIKDRRKKRVDIYTGKKRKGCSSCGKKRNGPPTKVRDPIKVLTPFPFTDKPKMTLICHCWPNGNAWRKHIKLLDKTKEMYHRRIMAVAVGPGTAAFNEVTDAFGPEWEYVEMVNDPRLHEVYTARTMQGMIQSTDENDVTVYMHMKGVKDHTANSRGVMWWIEAMYDTVVYNVDGVIKELEAGYSITGSFRRYGNHFKSRYGWHYSGTFYAFRNAAVFSGGIPEYDNRWWGTESWVGQHFGKEESSCIFNDRAGNLYQENEGLKQQLVKWKQENENRS